MATLNVVKLKSLYPSRLAPEPVAMCLNPHRAHTHVYSRLSQLLSNAQRPQPQNLGQRVILYRKEKLFQSEILAKAIGMVGHYPIKKGS